MPSGWAYQNFRSMDQAYEELLEPVLDPEAHRLHADVQKRVIDRLARERTLATPEREVLERMFARGNLLLFAALNAEAYLNIILVYLARDKAYFLYGVSGAGRGDGAGQLIHWEAIKHLKNRGIAWYDLGGVPSTDSTNGIFLFKKSLGGELVSLGSEFFYCPAALQSLLGYYQRFRARV